METSVSHFVSEEDVGAALRSLSLPATLPVPILGLQGSRDGGLVFANAGMLQLFGVPDLLSLQKRLFEGQDAGALRLIDFADTLPTNGGPRLERLRFSFGRTIHALTFLCRRVSRDGESLLIAAALGVTPALLRAVAPEPEPTPEEAQPLPIVEEAAPTERHIVRFVWRTDTQGRLTAVGPALAEAVGVANDDLVGSDFAATLNALDPTGRLQEALISRASWSGLRVTWPVHGASGTVPVTLGAMPSVDRHGGFEGYRGFGLLEIERPTGVPSSPVPASSPQHSVHASPVQPSSPEPVPPAPEPSPPETSAPALDIVTLPEVLEASPETVPKPHPETKPESDPDTSPDLVPSLVPELVPALEFHMPPALANVVTLRPTLRNGQPPAEEARSPRPIDFVRRPELTVAEQKAFREIARALGGEENADLAGSGFDAPIFLPAPGNPLPASGTGPENLRTVLDRLNAGVLVSRDDTTLFVNRFMLDLLGFADLVAFASAGGLAHLFVRPPSNDDQALALRTRSGDIVAANVRVQSVEWDGLCATLFTIRRSEESALRATLEGELGRLENEVRELNAILDTATDGVALIDAQGRILNLNRSGEALFGYDQTEIAGSPFTTLFAPDEQAKAWDYFEGLKSNGVASLLNDGREMIGRARQGGAIPIFMTLGHIGAGEGGELKFCALLRDMTHWKKIEGELETARREAERASAAKSDFLAKISHEIRTPLNAILGFAEVISDEQFGPVGNERYRDYLKDIHASGVHVMSLVNDLLDLSKIEAGKMDLAFAAVDANKVISECVSLMQPQASRERVITRLSLAPRLPLIFADERSLRQIVLNLLSNAVKFNEPGGQVIVATQLTEAGHAVIRVRDTGIGMSDSDIETALEPFRQVDTSRASTGTGLGLPLTKALVEANCAFFSIKSKKQEGTLVEITFPPARVLAE